MPLVSTTKMCKIGEPHGGVFKILLGTFLGGEEGVCRGDRLVLGAIFADVQK